MDAPPPSKMLVKVHRCIDTIMAAVAARRGDQMTDDAAPAAAVDAHAGFALTLKEWYNGAGDGAVDGFYTKCLF